MDFNSVDDLFGELARTYKSEFYTILADDDKMLVTPNSAIPRDRPVTLSEIRKLATIAIPFTEQ